MLYVAWKRGLPWKFARFVLFGPIKKHSFNLLCVLDLLQKGLSSHLLLFRLLSSFALKSQLFLIEWQKMALVTHANLCWSEWQVFTVSMRMKVACNHSVSGWMLLMLLDWACWLSDVSISVVSSGAVRGWSIHLWSIACCCQWCVSIQHTAVSGVFLSML